MACSGRGKCQCRCRNSAPFGRRLRAAGVSFEDRQDLLGHRSGRVTTHYSAAELANLIVASEKAIEEFGTKFPQTIGSSARQMPKISFNIKELIGAD